MIYYLGSVIVFAVQGTEHSLVPLKGIWMPWDQYIDRQADNAQGVYNKVLGVGVTIKRISIQITNLDSCGDSAFK